VIRWYFAQTEIDFEENGKTGSVPGDSFIVSDELLETIRAFVAQRPGTSRITKTEVLGEAHFDLPGVYAMGQPMTLLSLGDSAVLSVPSGDVRPMLNHLRKAPIERLHDNTPICSVGGFLRWLILTPSERDRLVAVMEAAVDGADQNAKEFWAHRESPSELLRRAQGISKEEWAEMHGKDPADGEVA